MGLVLSDRAGFVHRLLFLRKYDVPSAGWFFASGCPICMGLAIAQVRPLTSCLALDEACDCTICARQPPSLRDLAFHSYYTLLLNINRFELTLHVTASPFRAAYDSALVDIERLLPPEFPSITVSALLPTVLAGAPMLPVPPDNPWVSTAKRTFASEEEVVTWPYT